MNIVGCWWLKRSASPIGQGVVLTEDKGIIEPLQLWLKALVAQLQVLLPSLTPFDTQIEALFESHPDAALFAALPGAGPHLAPRLFVAFGDDRQRYQSAQDL